MTANYTPVYDDNGTDIEITLDASIAAIESPDLIKRFSAAIRANSAQGYRLLLDPNYFNAVKAFITDMRGVQLLDAKRRWGERLLRDPGYLEAMAKLAIRECVSGIASLDNQGQQVVRALIPARLENGVLQSISDEIIVAAVAELSNDNTLIQILVNQGEL